LMSCGAGTFDLQLAHDVLQIPIDGAGRSTRVTTSSSPGPRNSMMEASS
jgi:hypothetical protein